MDVEEFIEMVKQHPCLYDYRISVNTNKKDKDKVWKDIAKKMEITSALAKNKWKNLKDNYTKHLKSITAVGGPYLKYLHWTWASNMEFMKKRLNLLSTQGSNKTDNLDDFQSTENIDSAQSSTKSDHLPVNYKKRHKRHMSTQDEFESEIIQYTVNKQDNGYDATDLIFLGYAKAIKSFSVRKQAEIKLKIAKMITDEEVAHYEETLYPESPGSYSHLTPLPENNPLTSKTVQIKSE